jgi:hypothetical protein
VTTLRRINFAVDPGVSNCDRAGPEIHVQPSKRADFAGSKSSISGKSESDASCLPDLTSPPCT